MNFIKFYIHFLRRTIPIPIALVLETRRGKLEKEINLTFSVIPAEKYIGHRKFILSQ